jgi:hypothetical protein
VLLLAVGITTAFSITNFFLKQLYKNGKFSEFLPVGRDPGCMDYKECSFKISE